MNTDDKPNVIRFKLSEYMLSREQWDNFASEFGQNKEKESDKEDSPRKGAKEGGIYIRMLTAAADDDDYIAFEFDGEGWLYCIAEFKKAAKGFLGDSDKRPSCGPDYNFEIAEDKE